MDTYEAPLEAPVIEQQLGQPLALGPSQSQAVAVDAAHVVALGIREGADALFRNDAVATGIGLPLDYFVAFALPIPVTFAHEEWHLAALRAGGLSGVDHVLEGEVVGLADADLAAFKARDPAGLVRAHAAGIEQQNDYVRALSDDGFAYAPPGWHLGPFEVGRTFLAPHRQAVEVNTFFYLRFCANTRTDDVIAYVDGLQPTELERDFTGPDCTAWARDLLRPDEPYAARGPHPSGVGVERYVGWSDLDETERELLRTQVNLHLLDLVNPALYGIERVRVGDGYATAALQHWLTPYGYAVDLHGGWRRAGPTAFGTVRLGFSDGQVLPSVGAEVRDLGLGRFAVDAEATAWVQPRELRWGAAPTPGGTVSARVRLPIGRVDPWLGVRLKSAGWEPGIAALGPAAYLTAGGRLGIGRARAVPSAPSAPAG